MGGTVRFLLDGEVQELVNPDPTATILNHLRYSLRRPGTKEGCAEGDCGACTVVIGEAAGNRVRYRAVNACILFLPQLDGRELVTVESLAGARGALHPVQQAMVDCHGSQCGFCTPGIVMSLYAHYLNDGAADTATLNDTLAGNLCRCTGYGPILEAGRKMYEYAKPADRHDPKRAAERLRQIQPDAMLEINYRCPLTGKDKRYLAPRSLDELAEAAARYPDAVILAGATDVGLWVTKQHRVLETVISINDVPELAEIADTGDALEIGAGVRYTDALAGITALYPDFGELIRRLGSVQIRNSGTIGGNIANGSPIGDSLPALIAAGAALVLRKGSEQRELPLEDYFVAYGKQDRKPGEFVEKVRLPKPAPELFYTAYKLSKRFDQDISGLCGAFAFQIEDGTVTSARLAFGGMAETPKRAQNAEAAFTGEPWSEGTVEGAMAALEQDFAPITDMRASAAYRMAAAKNLLMKAWRESQGTDTRVLEACHG
ncbi:MAG: xanthine dehydrogenase small subunit [Sphingomonadales bacterium]|nr:xanthine dehydrogenase small subunit [Sphingomonadales bacterium]